MSTSPQRRGFTLIEILVVIAIIGILMAILIPVLNKARESAYKSTCASNIKNTCYAMNQYALDEDGWYISAVEPNAVALGYANGYAFFAGSIGPYMGLAPVPPDEHVTMEDISDAKVWLCPTGFRNYSNGKPPSDNLSSFGVSVPLYNYGSTSDWRVHEDEVDIPSKTVLLGESREESDGWNRAINIGAFIRYSHAKESANWGFFDGHVASLQKHEVPTSISSTTTHGSTPYVGTTFWQGKAP